MGACIYKEAGFHTFDRGGFFVMSILAGSEIRFFFGFAFRL